MRILTWNLERKKPTSLRGEQAVEHLYAQRPDVAVLTEVRTSFPARGGHLLFADVPLGDWLGEDERKVCIWSAVEIEPVAFDSPIDPRRFVAGRIATSAGSLLVLGVCIPWHMAEVTHRAGRKRKPWEMHLIYLQHLRELMDGLDEPFVVAGDFNQRYPRVKRASRVAAEAMEVAFEGLTIATAGTVPGCDRPGIDHIAVSAGVAVADVAGWRNDANGNRMSDHDGTLADVRF